MSAEDVNQLGKIINDNIVEALEGVVVPQLQMIDTRLGRLETKVDSLEIKVDSLEVKVDSLEEKVNGLDTRMGQVEDRMDGLEEKMDTMNGRLAENLMNHEERITEIERKAKFVAVA